MLIVAVLSARELTVALQYRLAADTMDVYIYIYMGQRWSELIRVKHE